MESDNESSVLKLIRECERRVANARTEYRLCILRFAGVQYFVEICRHKERAGAYLGEDAACAYSLFERLVQGTVTPCTLRDIVEDIRCSQG